MKKDFEKENIKEHFKYILQSLSQSYKVQISLYPDFVIKADELALDFENWSTAYVAHFSLNITQEQKSIIERIDKLLETMSNKSNLWTDNALKENKEWEQVRILSNEALELFDFEIGIPPSNKGNYIK